jgi:glycosyltransferase involved in cell wall biosynthesis
MTIFNGVDLKHFNSRAYNSAKDMDSLRASTSLGPIIVCVARLSRQKRIDILLEALSLVRVSHPACKCIIVGSGPLEGELHAHSTRLGLAAIVDFVGHVEDVRPYLQKADLFVLSSEREGLPLSLGEAMAHGVPCIATDVGGNREIIAHGNTGLIVEPGSPEQLAQAIDYLLVHPEERSRMAANGKRRVQEHFNIDKTMKRLIDVLVGEPS